MVTRVTVTILSVTQRLVRFFVIPHLLWAKVLCLKAFPEIHLSRHLSHISPVISPMTPHIVSLSRSVSRIPYYKSYLIINNNVEARKSLS